MSGILCPSPRFQALDINGSLLVGGQLYSYQAGSTTLQATYSDATLATPNANPTILDAHGSASVWLDPTKNYKLVLQDANGVQQWSQDNVSGGGVVQTNPGADQTISSGHLEVTNGIDGPLGTVTPASATATDVTVTASSSKVRLNNFTALGQGVSVNLQPDGATRDVPARWGYALVIDSVNGGAKMRFVSPGGTVKDYAPRLTIGANFGTIVNTGNTTQNTVLTRTLVGGSFGTNGGLRVQTYLTSTVQGVTPIRVSLFANGVEIAFFNTIANQTGAYKWEVMIGGGVAGQLVFSIPMYTGGSTTPQGLAGTSAGQTINTAADVALDIRITNGANTDSIALYMCDMEIVSTFAM